MVTFTRTELIWLENMANTRVERSKGAIKEGRITPMEIELLKLDIENWESIRNRLAVSINDGCKRISIEL